MVFFDGGNLYLLCPAWYTLASGGFEWSRCGYYDWLIEYLIYLILIALNLK